MDPATINNSTSASSSSSMSPPHTSENHVSPASAQRTQVSSPWTQNPIVASQSEAPIVSVMGASSWPTISETTIAPSNQASSDSLTSLGDVPSSSSASIPVSQGIANASVPAPMQAGASLNPTPGHWGQRSSRRNSTSGSANGSVSHQSVQGSSAEFPSHNRGLSQRNGNGNHHQSHSGTDRDSFRNQNGNQGNQNWTYHRNFNGNAQSQRGAPAFVRHTPQAMQPIHQYMAAQPIQPFGSHVPYPYVPYYHHMPPYIAHVPPAPVFYHVPEPPLNVKLQTQIHYYFSDPNLIKDTYLRGLMDDQGFVPLREIASFRRIRELTSSVQQIAEALQGSPVVVVQGERIRKRQNWQTWILPKVSTSEASSSGSGESGLGNLSLEQSSADPVVGSSSQLQPAEATNNGLPDGQQQSSGVNPVSNHDESDGAES